MKVYFYHMTQPTLFPVEEVKKMRVRKPDPIKDWMRTHGVVVHFAPHMKPWCWTAWVGTLDEIPDSDCMAEGKTRNQAILALCDLRGDLPHPIAAPTHKTPYKPS